MIYLDYAAATPLDPAVLKAMQPYFTDKFYNPSATYAAAQSVHKDIEAARARVAHWLGARPTEVVFTAGGTEANNLAIRGVLNRYPWGNVVVSALEHESILTTAGQAHAELARRIAPVTPAGIVDVEALVKLIDENTVLVSVMYANNEVGTIQPIRAIAEKLAIIRKQRRASGNNNPLYFHTDAAQAAAYLDLHAARLGVDMLTLNAGKIYGPKQTGALFVASHVQLEAQIAGGGQERNLRSGTENVAGIIGLSHALDIVQNRRHQEAARLAQLQHLFIQLLEEHIPGVIINGSLKTRLPNNVHITIPGQDNERLIFALDELGVQCAAGSACSASDEEPSHVLRAMGISDTDAQSSLRFTMGVHTTEDEIRATVAHVKRCL
ncbi:MAG TPA: cysteine desulfurase family protein [Patescibacteria group bacterium]|nr:cysteine desulfurase family protein [Patescibacteria group bacterium]